MDKKTLFITGFPGFIGRRILLKLLQDPGHVKFYLLVQDKFAKLAENIAHDISEINPKFKDRIEILVGDISRYQFGLDNQIFETICSETNIIYHLAALYDLSASRAFSAKINMRGTEEVINFAKDCKNLSRFNYFSTCYVSGKRTGKILEEELDCGQEFKNFYEWSKFEAEVLVKKAEKYIPTTIFRPSIVVGDSASGRTDKYDGLYYIMYFLLYKLNGLPMINIGKSDARVNIIPVDYLVEATVHIAKKTESAGKTFHVADTSPIRATEILDYICRKLKKRRWHINFPAKIVEVLFKSKTIKKISGIPLESIIYFNHDVEFDTSNTDKMLADSDIRCPRLLEYMDNLLEYVQNHKKP